MRYVAGSAGSVSSIGLRLGQIVSAAASIFFMSLGGYGFYTYTAFCFLVTIMGLALPWSWTLAMLDIYVILAQGSLHQSGMLQVIVLGDFVLSILTLAAACSTASIVDVLLRANAVSLCPPRLCTKYQASTAFAFLSWLLSTVSCLCNLWLLPKLDAAG